MTGGRRTRALRRYPELEGRTFLLGVGAMKAATSWVHGYLAGLDGATVSPVKELHYFNAVLRPSGHVPMTGQVFSVVRDYLEHAEDPEAELAANPEFQAAVDRLRMVYDRDAYFGLFSRLCGPQTRVLSESTPQYAMLGAAGFAHVREVFATQGLRLKLFFILRDPVGRLWSHLRHLAQDAPGEPVLENWREVVRRRAVIERSDYRMTVEALDTAFAPEDVCYLFYEDLFAGRGLQDFCAFAGLDYRPPLDTARRNETAVKAGMPDAVRAALGRLLAPQYAFCRDRFGKAVPGAWQGLSSDP